MNCPDCNRLTWPYDDHTLTCKNGHHTAVGSPEPVSKPARGIRWAHLIPALSGAFSGAAVDLLLRHL